MTRVVARIACMQNRPARNRTYGGVDANLREEDRRKKLIEAGLEAFGTRGYAKTNIRTICRLAGLTERYFYESFGHKEDLLCALYRELVEEERTYALSILEDPSIESRVAALRSLRMFYHRFQEDPRRARVQLFEILGVSPQVDREYQSAMRMLSEMVRLFLGRMFPDIDRETLNSSIIPVGLAGSMIHVSHKWVLDGFTMPLDDIVNQVKDLFTAVGKHLAGGVQAPERSSGSAVHAKEG